MMASRKYLGFWLAAIHVVTTGGCAGGGNSTPTPPPPSPNFTLSVPANASVISGQQTAATISINPSNGFAEAVTLSVSGLPAGVTGSFSQISIVAGQKSELTLAAAAGSLATTANVTVNGVQGALSASGQISLSVLAAPSAGSSRSAHVYVDGYIRAVVYDPTHKLVFCSNQWLNEVEVISTVTKKIVTRLPIPQAYSLALSPDNATLWVGTTGDYFYSVDVASMHIISRNVPTKLGDTYLSSIREMAATANGSLLLRIGQVNVTAEGLVQYFPLTGRFVDRSKEANAVRFFRNADGTKVLLATYGEVTLYDSASDSFLVNRNIQGSPEAAIRNDGTQIAMRVGPGMAFLNDQLQQVGYINQVIQSSAPVYSADGKRVYFAKDNSIIRTSARFTAYDAETFAELGDIPDLFFITSEYQPCTVIDPCDLTPYGTTLRISEESGLLIGPTDNGLGFVDSDNPRSLPTIHASFNHNFPSYAVIPTAGALGQNANVTLNGSNFTNGTEATFGGAAAAVTGVSADQSTITAVAPKLDGPGPVNVVGTFPDGWSMVAPMAYSYGPQVQYYVPMGDSPSGGSSMVLFGYGFGDDASKISVSIGGAQARVIGSSLQSQTVPIYQLSVVIPAGTPGPADIIVRSPSGSTTISTGFHYLQSVKDYVLGNNFTEILLDEKRGRVYLLDPAAKTVQGISTASGQVIMSAATGTRPRDMVLTPDAAKLVVANYDDGTLSVINPDDPNTPVVVSVAIPNDTYSQLPRFLAATANGEIFIGYVANLNSLTSLEVFDLATHSLVPMPNNTLCGIGATVLRSTKDGTRVMVAQEGNSCGGIGLYDPVGGAFVSTRELQDFLFDPTVAPDGSRVLTNDQYILDASSKLEGQISLPGLIAGASSSAVYGTLLQDSGDLMYLPQIDGVQIYDLVHGRLLRSYSGLNVASFAQRSIALDITGKKIYAVTPTGLEITELDSVPLSIGHVDLASGKITIHGSGFTASSKVQVEGASVPSAFVDSNTLQVNVTTSLSGSMRVSVTNPDGEQFDLDAAIQSH
jgi:DNA-binding beta-propeller fold protein YncE